MKDEWRKDSMSPFRLKWRTTTADLRLTTDHCPLPTVSPLSPAVVRDRVGARLVGSQEACAVIHLAQR